MLWKTHISISNQVLRTIGINLSDEVYSKYKAGIIAPDQWQDFPHHYGKSNDITKYLLYARQSYLQDNLEDTFYYLGVAMHYIQDSYTSVISYRSQINQIWHHNYEQSIEDSPFVEDIQKTIQYYFRDDYSQLNKYSKIAFTLSGKIEGKNNTLYVATLTGHYPSDQTGKPIVDRNLALKACCTVTQSILSSKTNSQLDTALKQSLSYHEDLLKQTELSKSKEIVDLASKIESMKSEKIVDSGKFSKLRNGLLALRVKVREIQLNSKYKQYVQRKHLFEVSAKYMQATENIIGLELGWYIIARPELNLSIIQSELIPFEESTKNLALDGRINCYHIGKHEIMFRKEIEP